MDALVLQKLPNEILESILDFLPIRDLLRTATICRQLHLLVVRSLHQRLLNVSSIPGYELILECYHPSAKISTPYLSCRYAGTRHPADCDNDQGGDDTSTRTTPHHQHRRPRDGDTGLSHVCRLYASFRPVVTEENRRRRFRMVWPVSVSGGPPAGFDSEDEVATQDLQLDDGELFSQLCTVLNLVTQGKAPGTFVTHYNMSEHVVRVFRRWLDEMSAAAKSDEAAWDPARKVPLASSRMLWVDAANTIGLRFHVSPGLAERMPLLSGPGEDPAVSYTLTYEELLVRSTSLLLAVEAAKSKEMEPSRNSIILSSATA